LVLIGVFLVAGAVTPHAVAAPAPRVTEREPRGAVVITGRVVHGETGRAVPGIEVRAVGKEAGRDPVEHATRSAEDGRFTLRADTARRAYVVQASYRGVVYTSGPHRPDGGILRVTLRVYETTEDPRGLYVSRRSILIEQTVPGTLDVREVVVVGNATPRTYIGQPDGDRRVTLRLPLPDGVREVSVRQGMAPLGRDTDGALVDSLPVTPGERQIVLTYQVHVRWTTAVLRVPAQLPTMAMDVFVAAPVVAYSAMLPYRENRIVQDRLLTRLGGANLALGVTVEVRLSGLSTPSSLGALEALGALALGLLVVLGAILPWMRMRMRTRNVHPNR
jgi:hypothetical protein